jgi:NAD(P)-dependent dehydrogenase (short-subunit alcohol dehydrogenase family)
MTLERNSMTDPALRVALVTGAAGGIGSATARRLAEDGPVAVCDIADERGQQVAADIEAAGGRACYLHLDVSDEQSWIDAVAATVAQFGGINTLVNNAGIGDWQKLEETSLSDWDRTIAVTQTGMFLGMKHCYPALSVAVMPAVVNMSSIYSMSGGMGVSPAYHAAKGAVHTLSMNAALNWAELGIRVNSVHPGVIITPLIEGVADKTELYRMTPMGRLGLPEEVAEAIAFLASPKASFITGAQLAIDGGFLAR